MAEAQVIKTYNGFYYVLDSSHEGMYSEEDLISCRVRGRLKRNKGAVVTGDRVEYELLPDGTGVIDTTLQRNSLLMRPAVANIDQVIIVFAAREPDISSLLVNRMLVMAEWSGIQNIVICINKLDIADEESLNEILKPFEDIGYRLLRVSAKDGIGIDQLKEILNGKVTVFAGPSGVGKSSLVNAIDSRLSLATGVVSEKIKRGKHTTRAAQLIPVESGGTVVDTPGFSAADLENIDKQLLGSYFPEFRKFIPDCYYNTCTHSHEPDCAVKKALEDGHIAQSRYDGYINILNTINERKKAY